MDERSFFHKAVPPRPVLTVLMVRAGEDILARGISQDVTIFEHLHFRSAEEVYRYMLDIYRVTHRVIFNPPPM